MTESPLKQNRIVPIDKLTAHPRNFRQHPDAQVAKLVSSLTRFGQGRSIVVQDGPQGYLIVAGHGIVEAAKKLGYTELRADILPANWTSEQVDGYLVADNMHSNDAQDDEELLVQLLQEQQDAGYDLASLGTDDESLRQMLEALGDEYLKGDEGEDEEEDDFDEEPDEEQTRVKLGDVWQLGRHKIACLSSTDQETYKKLLKDVDVKFVWADPPYGIDIVATNGYVGGGEAYDIPFGGVKYRKGDVGGGASHMRKTGKPYLADKPARGSVGAPKPFGSKNVRGSVGTSNIVDVGKYFPVIGEDSVETAVQSSSVCLGLFPKAIQVWWGANYYAQALPHSSCWIVWDKENTGNFADAELAWCSDDSPVRIFKHMWNGMIKDSERGQRRVHPTQKPIALAEWAFEKYGAEDDIIFDPFLGSGISVIAAEKMPGNRKVIGCELSPDYINIIISRWEKHTGQTATLLERVEEAAHA
jgi:ParB-like chromosome segregation protein Spo0J